MSKVEELRAQNALLRAEYHKKKSVLDKQIRILDADLQIGATYTNENGDSFILQTFDEESAVITGTMTMNIDGLEYHWRKKDEN